MKILSMAAILLAGFSSASRGDDGAAAGCPCASGTQFVNADGDSAGGGPDSPQTSGPEGPAQDAAFARYVDVEKLVEAIRSGDASLLADVALQLAEGERVLLRPHRVMTAKRALRLAVKLAARRGDKETLARLKKHAARSRDASLAAAIDAASKLAGPSRSADPRTTVSLDELSTDQLEAYKQLMRSFDAAVLLERADMLPAADEWLNGTALSGLPDRAKAAIRERIGTTRKLLAASRGGPDENASVEVLAKLMSTTRDNRYSVVCFVNRLRGNITVQFKWFGESGWRSYTLAPGKGKRFWKTYQRPNQNTRYYCYLKFDVDGRTGKTLYYTYDMQSQPSRATLCNYGGSVYALVKEPGLKYAKLTRVR